MPNKINKGCATKTSLFRDWLLLATEIYSWEFSNQKQRAIRVSQETCMNQFGHDFDGKEVQVPYSAPSVLVFTI